MIRSNFGANESSYSALAMRLAITSGASVARVVETPFQLLDAGGLDKESQCLVAVILFDVEPTYDVDVEDDVAAAVENALDLALQGAVVFPGIDNSSYSRNSPLAMRCLNSSGEIK